MNFTDKFIDKKESLPPKAKKIICLKATELPNSGAYNQLPKAGTYLCRRCGLALFRGVDQFDSHCGWPSFDAKINDNVQSTRDVDGHRMEITCTRCESHLGHVFHGEYFTVKNTRFCVNSLSLDFVPEASVQDTEEVIVAGGCFWGVDYFLREIPGVIKVEAGYIGGTLEDPSYEAVCYGNTGHYEAVRVVYDISKTDCESVYRRFFEIHDPTQANGQGGDIGQQYQSAIFYYNQDQYEKASQLIQLLEHLGHKVTTKLFPMHIFWQAEDKHQDFYLKHKKRPYCHFYVPRFAGLAE